MSPRITMFSGGVCRHHTSVVALAALSTLSGTRADPSVVPWKQDRFAISFWVDPVVPPDRFDAEYATIAAANFTVLLGGFGATTPETVTQQIASANKAGLAVVPSICGGACANLTGAWGFQITDEPAVPAFPKVAALVAQAKAVGNMAFVNLLPNYASPAQFGAPDYGTYVKDFVEQVKPNMLSMDHYPDFDEDTSRSNKTKAGYIANLLVLREAALSTTPPIPFWNFFNAMPYNGESVYDVSEGEMRWQAFTSLAIGSKGVLYFCYWTPPGNDFLRGQAIMTAAPGSTPDNSNQVPGPKYPIAQRINTKLRVYGDWLLDRTSSAVIQTAGGRADTSPIVASGCPFVSINGSNLGTNWSFLLGLYDDNHTVVLSNQDCNHPALASVTLASSVASLHEVSPMDGAVVPALDDAPFMDGFQVSLQPGDARVFLTSPDAVR
eukprot:m.27816 g.27816  ORF g.27816 m.27816 type:complete len:438 (-) comp4455_c0_seq1:116-1429(-)